ncbi:hypothetical protein GIW15_25335 [Pseudomonas lurida]|nr:hypothetical protein [Pseudomonas lurida]MCF5308940.1 hypothetical protein [Pseudomonas lurida]MCF5327296.1 hypothetical protein [Pseudomonas lurida]
MTFDIRHISELRAWLALDDDPAFVSGTPEYRYETRLAMTDDLKSRGIIDTAEWRELVAEASTAYTEEVA